MCSGNSAPPRPPRPELRTQSLFPGGCFCNGPICAGTRGPAAGPGRAGPRGEHRTRGTAPDREDRAGSRGQHPSRGNSARAEGTAADPGAQRGAGGTASGRQERDARYGTARHGTAQVCGGCSWGAAPWRAEGPRCAGQLPPRGRRRSAAPPGHCRACPVPAALVWECRGRGLLCHRRGVNELRELGLVVLARCSPAAVLCTRALC